MIGAACLYAAAVVWLTWPLAARLTTDLPATHPACGYDLLQTAWVLAHESRALVASPAAFADAPIYHPTPGALFYADAAFGALPFFLPPFLLTGNPTLAVNLALLVPTVLTALALHAVTRSFTGSHLAGAIAGATFLTTRWTLWSFAPTAPQYAALFWFPFVILLATRPRSRRRDLTLAVLIALQSLSSPVYVLAALVVPLAVVAAGRLARPGTRADGLGLLAAIGMATALVAPVAAGYVAVRLANPDLAAQSYWTAWRPITELPWGPLAAPQIPTAVPPIAFALVAAGLVSRALPWSRRAAPSSWPLLGYVVLWAVAGIVLSIAPAASWYGHPIRVPQTLLAEWIPLYGTLRETARLGVAGLMGLSLAAGLGFALCAARLPARGRGATVLAGLLAVVVIAEMYREYRAPGAFGRAALAARYSLAPAPATADALALAVAAGEGAVLELPADLVPSRHARAMYRAIFHRRPLVNGYGGYWPQGFPERMALASRLPDADALATLRRETGLRTVIVDTAALRLPDRARWGRVLVAGAPGLRKTGVYDGVVVLDVSDE